MGMGSSSSRRCCGPPKAWKRQVRLMLDWVMFIFFSFSTGSQARVSSAELGKNFCSYPFQQPHTVIQPARGTDNLNVVQAKRLVGTQKCDQVIGAFHLSLIVAR